MRDPEHQCKYCQTVWVGLEIDCPNCEAEAIRRLKAKGWPTDSISVDLEILNMRRRQLNAL